MKKLVVLLLLTLPVMLFALISYLGHNIVKPQYTPVEAVEIKTSSQVTINNDMEKVIILDKDGTYQLTYDILPYIATQKQVSFNSSDENFVTVSETGEIIAVEYTTNPVAITIITESNKKTDFVFVTVSSVNAREVTFTDGEEIELELYETHVLDYVIYPASAINYTTVSFAASNDAVSVDQGGLIKALKQGETYITVTTNGNLKDSIKVNVTLGYTGYLPEEDVVTVSNTYTFPKNSSTENYVWEIIEGGEYAEIDPVTGEITFTQKNQQILVRFTNLDDDSAAEIWIESVADVIQKITIEDKFIIDMSVRLDGKFKLNPKIFPQDATLTLTYSVLSGESFLAVDGTGGIVANGNGKGTIRISANAEVFKDVEIEVICPPFSLALETKYANASLLVGKDGIALGIGQNVEIGYVISKNSFTQVEMGVEILLVSTDVLSIDRSALPSLRTASQAACDVVIDETNMKFSITPKVTGKYHLAIISKANTQGKVSHSQLYVVEINEGINVTTYQKMRELFDNQSLERKLIINLLANIDVTGELWDNWSKTLIDTKVGMSHDFTVFMVQNYTEINGNSFEISIKNLKYRTNDTLIQEKTPNAVMFRTYFYGEYSSNNTVGIKSQFIMNHTTLTGNADENIKNDQKPFDVPMLAFYTGILTVDGNLETRRGAETAGDLFSLKGVTVQEFHNAIKINNMDRARLEKVTFANFSSSVGYFSQCREVKINDLSMYGLKDVGIEFLETESNNCGYVREWVIDPITNKSYQKGEPMRADITGYVRIGCWVGISSLPSEYAILVNILRSTGKLTTNHMIKLDADGKYNTGNPKSDFIMIPFVAPSTEVDTPHYGNDTIITIDSQYIDEIRHDVFGILAPDLAGNGFESMLFVANIRGNAEIMKELAKNTSWPALNT